MLDCGCGMGDWLYWLKTVKGCKVMGINVTDAHVVVVKKRGMECIHSDWQTLYADRERFGKLAGQFDCVTFWDTIEHYCKASEITVLGGLNRQAGTPLGCEAGTPNEQVRAHTYGSLFKMAGELLDPSSPCGTVWSSTLHQNHSCTAVLTEAPPAPTSLGTLSGPSRTDCALAEDRGCPVPNVPAALGASRPERAAVLPPPRWKEEGLYGFLQIYAMISYYDGVYPYLHDGLSKYASYGGFKLIHEEDRTEDYRMTSLVERNHFGCVSRLKVVPTLTVSRAPSAPLGLAGGSWLA